MYRFGAIFVVVVVRVVCLKSRKLRETQVSRDKEKRIIETCEDDTNEVSDVEELWTVFWGCVANRIKTNIIF